MPFPSALALITLTSSSVSTDVVTSSPRTTLAGAGWQVQYAGLRRAAGASGRGSLLTRGAVALLMGASRLTMY